MIGERIRELRKDARMSMEAFGSVVGTSKQYVNGLEKGANQRPNGEFLEGWARHFNVNMRWLVSGKGAKHVAAANDSGAEWPDIRAYHQAVGLGDGVEASDYEETHKLKFRADSLARKGLRPDNLAVVYGKGDSMLPRIQSGDAILFDTSDTRPVDGGLFVIAIDGTGNLEYNVKRCKLVDDLVLFEADNPAGDHTWRSARNMANKRHPIKIVGRVRWIGSWEG